MTEFQSFPKIARLNRDIVITEKIDGTNAAIGVEPIGLGAQTGEYVEGQVRVYAQSRSRIITPEDDNFGFAKWVRDNADKLAEFAWPRPALRRVVGRGHPARLRHGRQALLAVQRGSLG